MVSAGFAVEAPGAAEHENLPTMIIIIIFLLKNQDSDGDMMMKSMLTKMKSVVMKMNISS